MKHHINRYSPILPSRSGYRGLSDASAKRPTVAPFFSDLLPRFLTAKQGKRKPDEPQVRRVLMNHIAWIRILPLLILPISACSAHNPFIVSNTTTSAPVSEAKFPPHTDKVFLTEQPLPSTVKFELVSTIDVGKVWYGSSKSVYKSLAERARQLGANAVVQVKTWHQPAGYSWSAPHGSGQAIYVDDMDLLDALDLNGSWH